VIWLQPGCSSERLVRTDDKKPALQRAFSLGQRQLAQAGAL
jgi:hypothetical protein